MTDLPQTLGQQLRDDPALQAGWQADLDALLEQLAGRLDEGAYDELNHKLANLFASAGPFANRLRIAYCRQQLAIAEDKIDPIEERRRGVTYQAKCGWCGATVTLKPSTSRSDRQTRWLDGRCDQCGSHFSHNPNTARTIP